MNIPDKLAGIAGIATGFMPARPDNVVAIFEYDGPPPEHTFGHTELLGAAQVRVRNKDPAQAKAKAEEISGILNRYHDAEISVLRTSPELDIGYDSNNPPRQEYTVNFTVRRY